MNKKYIGKERESDLFNTYTVKEGDTLYKISKDNDIDIEMLSQINGLDSYDYLYQNQQIIIPKKDVKLYITKELDTLNEIVNSNNIDISRILEFNKNIYLLPNQLIIYRE